MKLTLPHWTIGVVLLVVFLASSALAPVETLQVLGLVLGALVVIRWPGFAVALLVAGTVTNIFGVASNVHGLPGIQVRLTFFLALVLLVRWALGKEDLTAVWGFAPVLVCAYAVSLLSLAHVENLEPTFEKLIELTRDLATTVVIVGYLTSSDRLRVTIKATVFCMGIIALLSVKQYFTGSFDDNFFGFAQASIKQIAGEVQHWRVSGALPDPNYYGQVLVMTLPLACCIAIVEKSLIIRFVSLVCALAILAASLLTFSRGTVLAIAAIVIAATLTLRARWWLLGAGLVLSGVGLLVLPSAFIDRIALIAQAVQIQITGNQAVSDASLSGRIAEMGTALRMFLDNPLVGIGLGQYPDHYSQYALVWGANPGAEPNAHSLILETLAEEGIVGFAKFATIIIIAIVIAIRGAKVLSTKGRKRDAAIATSLCIGFVGYLATALFLHGAFLRFFWIEIALLLSVWRISAVAAPKSATTRDTKERSSNMVHRTLSSGEVLSVLRERKLLVATVTTAFMLVSLVGAQYSVAESTLLYRFGREYFPVRPGEEHRNWGENVQVSLDAALFTEMHLLRSREVIEATVSEVGLDKLAVPQNTVLSQISELVKEVIPSLDEEFEFGSWSGASKRAVDPNIVAAKDLAERLRIRRVEGAAMIAVGIQDADPEIAERIVTAHVESYLRKRQQLFERDPSKFYRSEIEKAQSELASIAEQMRSLRLEQGVPDETVEHSVLSDRLIALERQRQSIGQADVPILQKDIKETREALFNLNALTGAIKVLEARYKIVTENLERMLQEQHRSRLDGAYVRELGPTIEIVEPAAFSSRPAGLPRAVRMVLGGTIGFILITGFLVGVAMVSRRRDDSLQSDPGS